MCLTDQKEGEPGDKELPLLFSLQMSEGSVWILAARLSFLKSRLRSTGDRRNNELGDSCNGSGVWCVIKERGKCDTSRGEKAGFE